VQVAGVGLCHSDILFLDAPPGAFPYELPFTLGHEIAGRVVRAPAGSGLDEGDAVVVSAHYRCSNCEFCIRGYDNYCSAGGPGLGFGRDGGLASYVTARRDSVVGPTSLDPVYAGPLADAGCTSYHAVQRALGRLTPGADVIVIGVGGLGGYAVQYLKLLSAARIIAVDASQPRLEAAASFGADVTLLSGPDLTEQVREVTHGRGADAVLDFVGSDATMATALAMSRPLGVLALVGAGGGTAPISWQTVARECDVFIPQGGTSADLHEVVRLAELGLLAMPSEVFSFTEVDEAYRRLRDGTLSGRAIVTAPPA
jgi:propanol-preferring alcohol dehydrogenase